MRLNKRGQIGKTITAFPVIISVFLIMVAFIALSIAGKLIISPLSVKENAPILHASVSPEDYLLFKKVSLKEREMYIFDIISEYMKGNIRFATLEDSMASVLRSGECLVFRMFSGLPSPGVMEIIADYSYRTGKGFSHRPFGKKEGFSDRPFDNQRYNFYKSKGLIQELKVIFRDKDGNKKEYEISFYYGKCLDEPK